MTIKEKANRIREYCDKRPEACKDLTFGNCPLAERETCYSFHNAPTERVVAENYEILFGKEAATTPDPQAEPVNIILHASVCDELKDLYRRKNTDYGDSFHKTYFEEGLAMSRIRLTDKLERFKRLTRSGEQNVKDESVRDTLIDLANYAIMTIVEMEREKE